MPQPSLDVTYQALADASRRAILRQLARKHSQSVSELSAPLAIGMPTVLKHIGVLVNARLVERTKSGRVVTITLRREGMTQAMDWLAKTETFWSSRLDRLAQLARKDDP